MIDFKAHLAEFLARIDAANLDAAPEVTVILHMADEGGTPREPFRMPIAGTAIVRPPDDSPEWAAWCRDHARIIYRNLLRTNVFAVLRDLERNLLEQGVEGVGLELEIEKEDLSASPKGILK